LPIGKEKDFRGVVDVVHMKAYELGPDGQPKEIDIPSEGRDIVDKTRERLVELVAESNDQLMEKYFEQGTLDEEDILPNINNAIAQSKLCPAFAVSSITQVGLRVLLNALVDYAPDPAHHEAEWGKPMDAPADAERIGRKYNDSEPFSAYCFRTVADPFAGRINIFKIISGHLGTDANAFNSTRGLSERLGALHVMQGKQLDKVTEAHAGDIVACVKLKETQTGDTLCDKQSPIVYDPVEYPEAAIAFAIEPEIAPGRGEDQRCVAQDPRRRSGAPLQPRRADEGILLSGSGQLHVETVVEKLKKRYSVEVTLHPPKVPYKETDYAARGSSGPAQEADWRTWTVW
jgi:elongation factor G